MISRVSGGTKTKAASTNVPLAQSFHPGWDKEPGVHQARGRAAAREAQGQKMTPKGPGKLRAKKNG